jgi:hypothetical protein
MEIKTGDLVHIKGGETCLTVVEVVGRHARCEFGIPGVEPIRKWIELKDLEGVTVTLERKRLSK